MVIIFIVRVICAYMVYVKEPSTYVYTGYIKESSKYQIDMGLQKVKGYSSEEG